MAQPQIEIPAEALAELCRRYHIRQLALFGSVLRDDFSLDSDVDVLVEFEPEAHIGFMALSRIQRELSALLQRPVDLVPKDGLKAKIRRSVLSSAEVVYAA
jgi:predicted nucleotidyltransferase